MSEPMDAQVETIVRAVVEFQKAIEDYRNGNDAALRFLVGQGMIALRRGRRAALAVVEAEQDTGDKTDRLDPETLYDTDEIFEREWFVHG